MNKDKYRLTEAELNAINERSLSGKEWEDDIQSAVLSKALPDLEAAEKEKRKHLNDIAYLAGKVDGMLKYVPLSIREKYIEQISKRNIDFDFTEDQTLPPPPAEG